MFGGFFRNLFPNLLGGFLGSRPDRPVADASGSPAQLFHLDQGFLDQLRAGSETKRRLFGSRGFRAPRPRA